MLSGDGLRSDKLVTDVTNGFERYLALQRSRALIAVMSSDTRVPHQAGGRAAGPLAASPARSLRADDRNQRRQRDREPRDHEPVPRPARNPRARREATAASPS